MIAAFTAALIGIRAADAGRPFSLSANQIPYRRTDDNGYDDDNDHVFHTGHLPFSE